MLLAEGIIPIGIMARYQVTHHIAQDLYRSSIAFAIRSFDHSLFTRLILWSAGRLCIPVLLTLGISIALIIHSFDPRWSEESWRISRSIDIALRWSA